VIAGRARALARGAGARGCPPSRRVRRSRQRAARHAAGEGSCRRAGRDVPRSPRPSNRWWYVLPSVPVRGVVRGRPGPRVPASSMGVGLRRPVRHLICLTGDEPGRRRRRRAPAPTHEPRRDCPRTATPPAPRSSRSRSSGRTAGPKRPSPTGPRQKRASQNAGYVAVAAAAHIARSGAATSTQPAKPTRTDRRCGVPLTSSQPRQNPAVDDNLVHPQSTVLGRPGRHEVPAYPRPQPRE
jgi:hypothetical protein